MFKKILIANRGEIALRIIRTCREMGIKTVAVYSTADADSLHVKFADEAVCIGPPASKESYLKIQSILAAAEITNAEAIHPGYGFLAENAEFSRICSEHNIKFIGPSPYAINSMGDKAVAKATMIKNKVPVVPGSDGVVDTYEEAKKVCAEIGFPVIIKASAGGGGRGMRVVEEEGKLKQNFEMCRQEASTAFNNPEVYIERFVQNPHHVEIQIMADSHGNVIHLGERDCSLQRRHQKVLEESPSPLMTPELRKRMGEASISAAKAVDYEGAGTVEYLVDDNENFYFMEMNTRIQVEHPVTEEVTGFDLIEEQIRVAYGVKIEEREIEMKGHAIECRINAEDPEFNFRPSAGEITVFHPPGGHGVRLDTHAYSGYRIPPYYDSMIAKLIVSAPTREDAIKKMKRSLEEFIIEGIKTTIPYHIQLMDDPNFQAGKFTTKYLENNFKFNPEAVR
ncbi:MAG: acetyl-CoA carboxylase biotin carboxylase subunit [Balneola sp.]|nr:acetyl-CoA carboxylase biotin carboxylase subunit [Balneola sp.]MBO6651192.1 acetyl-CoA carboxylase biotin carboxylase subunit [Balneola sp.]MBO6710381.1 acetyl-CoA carboxylase biotin carboxylase subunit [Balneola sp.]MBO6799066.1 acetyl-CoA carboxylase biotin carboxylase subunit [Balneola sp.]MBO6870906.1 acetyl-CoA carboxylase biotin carboxylase subunit [Balneola sp.]